MRVRRFGQFWALWMLGVMCAPAAADEANTADSERTLGSGSMPAEAAGRGATRARPTAPVTGSDPGQPRSSVPGSARSNVEANPAAAKSRPVVRESRDRAGAAQDEPARAGVIAADSGMPPLRLRRRSLESLGTEPPLALEINAGVIPRSALHAELARGIGAFLRQVRTEPALVRGRFVGWRVLGMFAGRDDVTVSVLRPGDTVLRINGRPLERPEEFKLVWDSLPTASELVVEIQRDGRASKLRYSIAD